MTLSKLLDLADYKTYEPQLRAVEDCWVEGVQASDRRKWEYLIALKALQEHSLDQPLLRIVDVGGAGSIFSQVCHEAFGLRAEIVDPSHPGSVALHEYLQWSPRLASAVTCLSVLEHVEDEAQLLYDLASLVVPGGLLVLTVDCAPTVDGTGRDHYHFHWMRKRIYDRLRLHDLITAVRPYALTPVEPPDYPYQVTPYVYDYTFASLVLRKSRKVPR